MADARYHKRRVAVARQKQKIAEDRKKVREFVADLPFSKLVLLQEIWERQHRVEHKKGTRVNGIRSSIRSQEDCRLL